jgi:DnaJ homolog subfamily B member 12
MNGGPGFRVHQFGGARPRARPRNQEEEAAPQGVGQIIANLLPIFLLFILPLLTSLFTGGGTNAPGIPHFNLEAPVAPFVAERNIKRYNAKYYVDPKELVRLSESKLNTLDKHAETAYVNHVHRHCEMERRTLEKLQNEANGWFFQDPVKMEQANTFKMPYCEKLNKMNRAAYWW